MQYDAAGNVTKIVDGVNSETVDYTYDDLDRLLTASVPTGESFAYDTIGNMTSKAGTALDYGTTTPKHAVKSHGTTTYSYDANGSLTAKGTQTIKYDPERRPILVQDGTSIHRAAYDGDGVRRKRDDDNGIVHYLGGYERKLAGGSETSDTVTKYYSASLGALSRPVAFRRGGTLHWVGSDHLGGTIRVLDSSFAALDGMRYKPYGEDRDTGSSLNTDRKFTGQTEDETAGLYWYASRAYDPAIGRFCSPDPIVPDPSNPQALNRYGYVYNNPLKYVDPSGHTGEGWDYAWADRYAAAHGGQRPTWSDWMDYQHSLLNPGSGPGGDWTNQDWANHSPTPVPAPTPDPPYSSGSSSAALQLEMSSASLLSNATSVLGVFVEDGIDSLGRVANLSDELIGRTKIVATGVLKGAGKFYGYTDAYQEELAAGKSKFRAHMVGTITSVGATFGEAGLGYLVLAARGKVSRSGVSVNSSVSKRVALNPRLGKIVEAGGAATGAEATKSLIRWIFDEVGLD